MLKRLSNKFSPRLYAQIWENRIRVTNLESGDVYEEQPLMAIETNDKGERIIAAIGNSARSSALSSNTIIVNPFSHPRALLSDFQVAEKLLQHIVSLMLRKKFLSPTPLMVIHPMEKTEGGLTMIEKRAFRELALGAGAREVVVFEGPQIERHNFDYEKLKAFELESESVMNKVEQPKYQLVMVMLVVAMMAMVVIYGN